MTDALIDKLYDSDHVRLVEFVRHTLAADIAQRRSDPHSWTVPEDPRRGIDVERLFAAIELLIDRHVQPWSPFVASWHAGLESFAQTELRPFEFSNELLQFERDLARFVKDSVNSGFRVGGDVQGSLGRLIAKVIDRSQFADVGRLLTTVRRELLSQLIETVLIDDPERTRYLTPLVDLAREQGALTIATLNYDLSIELVTQLETYPCDTGIETWLSGSGLRWATSGVRLLKLHGSIDWKTAETPYGYGADAKLAQEIVEKSDPSATHRDPAIIFGEAGKLRAQGPFLELLLAWSQELANADSLLIVGYSFRDPHVNETIARWFNVGSRRIVLVDPEEVELRQMNEFRERLTRVNEQLPNQPPTPQRFDHVQATTAAGLVDAITRAKAPVDNGDSARPG